MHLHQEQPISLCTGRPRLVLLRRPDSPTVWCDRKPAAALSAAVSWASIVDAHLASSIRQLVSVLASLQPKLDYLFLKKKKKRIFQTARIWKINRLFVCYLSWSFGGVETATFSWLLWVVAVVVAAAAVLAAFAAARRFISCCWFFKTKKKSRRRTNECTEDF